MRGVAEPVYCRKRDSVERRYWRSLRKGLHYEQDPQNRAANPGQSAYSCPGGGGLIFCKPGPCAFKSRVREIDRKSTRLNSSHMSISYAVFCLKKKKHIKS